eukprot:5997586-Lingulodinium_polyedra.AAC.1
MELARGGPVPVLHPARRRGLPVRILRRAQQGTGGGHHFLQRLHAAPRAQQTEGPAAMAEGAA